MNVAYSLLSRISFVFQNKEKIYIQMFVIHLNGKNLKTLLIQILVIKMSFPRKLGGMHFSHLPVGKI